MAKKQAPVTETKETPEVKEKKPYVPGPRKSCPITRAEFKQHAQNLEITIDGVDDLAVVKEFSSGSLGWYFQKKQEKVINGKTVVLQIGLNVTVNYSKDLPKEEGK